MRRSAPNRPMEKVDFAGHFNYYAVPGNIDSLGYSRFREPSVSRNCPYRDLKRVLLIAAAILAARKLSGFDGEKTILRPYPPHRFAASHPR